MRQATREREEITTMDAYIYQAALYCEDCALRERERLSDVLEMSSTGFVDYDDSSVWPAGPYADGGGEADTPQHCDPCGVFLENPLTGDGYEYVRDAITEAPVGYSVAASVWAEFYAIELALDSVKS
jgi:hypothetical protein